MAKATGYSNDFVIDRFNKGGDMAHLVSNGELGHLDEAHWKSCSLLKALGGSGWETAEYRLTIEKAPGKKKNDA